MFATNAHTINIVAAVILFDAVFLAALLISAFFIVRKFPAMAMVTQRSVIVVFMGVVFVTALLVAFTHALIPQWAFRDALGIFFVPTAIARSFLQEKKPSRRSKRTQVQTNSLDQFQAIQPDPYHQ